MQRVPELVEQRVHLVEGEQRRLAVRRPRHVEVVDHDGPGVEQPRLPDERAHPRAAALALPGEEVAEVEPDRGAVAVADLPDPDVGVVAGQVRARGETEAVEQFGGVEDAVDQDPVQLEVRPQRRGVDGVALGPDLLGVERPVPRRELDAVAAGGLGEHCRLRLGVGHRRRDHGRQHRVDRRGGARGGVGQHEVGVGVEAQQSRALGPQPRDPHRDRAVVVLPRGRAPDGGLEHPPAQVPVAQLRQHRLAGRQEQRQQVALDTAVRGSGGRGRELLVVQPVEVPGVGDLHRGGLGGQLQVLAERGRQRRELLVQLGEPGATGLVELRSGQHEVQVIALDQPHGLGVEAGVVPGRVHRIDAGEQRRIQVDRIGVRRLQRGDLPLDLAQPRGGHRRGEVAEHVLRPRQQPARPLQRDHRVVERRRLRRADDRGDLGALLDHPGEQRLEAVLGGDVTEGRQGERQRRDAPQRVVRGHGGGADVTHRCYYTATLRAAPRPRAVPLHAEPSRGSRKEASGPRP